LASLVGAHSLASVDDHGGPVKALAERIAYEGAWRRVVAAYTHMDILNHIQTVEDIATIDTTTPWAQQGPLTRAQARLLNYQVKSFLAVQTSSYVNGVLLNKCDDFLMFRNLGHEPDWRESNHNNKHV
jgi:hypothetical protein